MAIRFTSPIVLCYTTRRWKALACQAFATGVAREQLAGEAESPENEESET